MSVSHSVGHTAGPRPGDPSAAWTRSRAKTPYEKLLTQMRSVPVSALILFVLLSFGAVGHAQSVTAPQPPPAAPPPPERSIEDLNLLGGGTTMPAFADTALGADSSVRRAMYRHGLLLRFDIIPRASGNLLDAPVDADQQVYIGQRPTLISGVNTIFTADLRQLGLKHAQLNAGLGWRYTTWSPAGPNTLGLTTLYFFNRWGQRRVEMKAGYLLNDLEFVGLQVGGSTSTGAQGVYAVLPNEVGLSYFPLTAPSVNVRVRASTHMYVKSAAQRSLDPAGGQSTVDRNPTGLRFDPAGNGVLLINEGGYQRPSTATSRQAWFRTGYMRNSTRYANRATGALESGNYCVYALIDYQLRMPAPASPSRGLFVGGSAITVPSAFNRYDRYYEVRLYQRGPFASRPSDVATVIASFRYHSHVFTDSLAAQGHSVWRSSTSLTGTYTVHAARGNFLSFSLGYSRGAAISPRVHDALTFTANWGLYL
jgi:porin